MNQSKQKRIKPRQNCWEFKKCGRELGGVNADEHTVCPASLETNLNGLNFGINGGRICWDVAGTFCFDDEPVGDFAKNLFSCMDCDFFKKVQAEEGTANFKLLTPRQNYMNKRTVS
ncbi:hypothetical protein KY328_05575 [Candidatus Woesearchaeota archaeon]|nr:hypothetical protein [Candidatus Woesearchaeota archaeon]